MGQEDPIAGIVTRDGVEIANFTWDSTTGESIYWYGGENIPMYIDSTAVYTGIVNSPTNYVKTLNVERTIPPINNVVAYGQFQAYLKPLLTDPTRWITNDFMSYIQDKVEVDKGDKIPEDVRSIKRYFNIELYLPQVSAYIYPNQEEVDDVLSYLTPPDSLTIFNTWTRFSADHYFPNGSQIPAGNEAAAWVWDNTLNAAVMPLNSATFVGFISDDEVDHYDNDVVVTSSATDDDFNGVVLAFHRDTVNNKNITLNAIINTGANGALPNIHIMLNGSTFITGSVILQSNNKDDVARGWSGYFKRIRVERRKDRFTIYFSKWNTRELDPELTMYVDLNSDPRLEVFKGPKSYGYCNQSQPGSHFKEIKFSSNILRNIVINALDNTIYHYGRNQQWNEILGLTAHHIYGAPRRISAIEGGDLYVLNKDGTITIPNQGAYLSEGIWSLINPDTTQPALLNEVTSVGIGKFIYVFGGKYAGPNGGPSNGVPSKSSWIYDTETNVWRELPAAPPTAGPSLRVYALVSAARKIWLLVNDADWKEAIYEFDTVTEVWTVLNSDRSVLGAGALPTLANGGAVYKSGKIYFFSGNQSAASYYGACYNVLTQTWEKTLAKMPTLRSEFACVGSGDDVYVFGGYTSTGNRNDLIKYSILNDTWSSVTPTTGARPEPTRQTHATLYRGAIYHISTRKNTSYGTEVDVWVFDIEEAFWKKIETKGVEVPTTLLTSISRVGSNFYRFFGNTTDSTAINLVYKLTLK